MNDMLSDWLRWNHGIAAAFSEADFHSYCSPHKTPTYGRGKGAGQLCVHAFPIYIHIWKYSECLPIYTEW